MKQSSRMKPLTVAVVVLAAAMAGSPLPAADTPPGIVRAQKVGGSPHDVVELGTTEIASNTKLPAAAGGDVFIRVRVTLRTSRDVVNKINEGISSGRFQPPYAPNKEFMDLLLSSRPGSFDIEFLELNKESRFYYFFEQQLHKVKTHPDIPEALRKKAGDLAQQAKKLVYQVIRPNDFKGAKLAFEQDMAGGRIVYFTSTKRGNKEAGRVTFTAQEEPILAVIRRVLTEQKAPPHAPPGTVKYSLDEIIKAAQGRGLLVSKP